jgi:hypothetical protein
MDARDYIAKQRALLQALEANAAQECLVITDDLLALTRLRVNTEGRDSTGARFSPYSPGYAKQRAKRGRQTAFVDFSDTGALWAAIRATVESRSAGSVTVVITARDALSQDKLAGALGTPKARPRGNILVPSAGELALAERANRARIAKYLL